MVFIFSIPQDKKEVTKKPISVRSRPWEEDEVEQLVKLYEEFKDAVDPVNRIIDHLRVKRPKRRIVEKIMGKYLNFLITLHILIEEILTIRILK